MPNLFDEWNQAPFICEKNRRAQNKNQNQRLNEGYQRSIVLIVTQARISLPGKRQTLNAKRLTAFAARAGGKLFAGVSAGHRDETRYEPADGFEPTTC